MKEGFYKLTLVLPCFILPSVLVASMVVLLFKRKLSFARFVAINAFSSIIKEKNDIDGGKRWLFKKVNLTGEKRILSKVFIGLFFLFTGLLATVFSIFWFLLLIDISYTCDEDDHTKECFEYKVFSPRNPFAEYPIDCNNPAIKNGTMKVVCYQFVFNPGVAMGASYGTFKIAMALINAATAGMLMVKQAKTIKKIKLGVIVITLAITATFTVISEFTRLKVYMVSDVLIYLIKTITLLGTAIAFLYIIPWKDLLVIKQRQNNPDNTPGEAALDNGNVRIPLLETSGENSIT